jgi:hypothetical protein
MCAATAVLDQLTAAGGTLFGVDLAGVRLEAADTDRSWETVGSGVPRLLGRPGTSFADVVLSATVWRRGAEAEVV